MEIKEVEISCPCCQSRLAVDVRTSKVIRWSPARSETEGGEKTPPADFDEISQRVEGRLGGAADKFEDNLEREKRRGQDLDELFRQANEKLKQDDEEEG